MDVVIIADFCGNFDGKGNSRFLYLAEMLSKKHSVEIVTSDFNHETKSHFFLENNKFPYKITMLHEGKYEKNVCLKRFWAHFIWGRSVANYLKTRKNPDVIYCAVPTLTAAYEAAKFCKINKIKFIIDIQDLWPEAFQMVFNVPIISKLVFLPFKWIADGIYKKADDIVAVSETYVQRALMVNKTYKSVQCVFLGTKLEVYDAYVANTNVNAELEGVITSKKSDECWLGYCGTLGHSYDLICVFDALKILMEQGYNVPKFIVMGDGPKRKEFESYAEKNQIDVLFTGKLLYSDMCYVLHRCDIAVNPIKKGAAQSIINKHADYAAAGIPVLNTQECEEYKELVDKYKMGFNCINGSADDLAKQLLVLVSDEKKRIKMGENARKCAEYCFDRKKTYEKIVKLIEMG